MFSSVQASPLAQKIMFSDAEKDALKASGWTLLCPYTYAIAEYNEKDCEEYIAVEM